MRWPSILLACLPPLLLVACGERAARAPFDETPIVRDPLLAAALHDPLMSDPDLASRNGANAAIGFADRTGLPVFPVTPAGASAAREALRLELIEAGPIPDLPRPQQGGGGAALGPLTGPEALLAAVGAPSDCAARLREDFALAATLPPAAAIPREAMVVQAGGADAPGCRIRIVRYTSAAAPEDVLQYHYARAVRARLTAQHHAAPAAHLAAAGKAGRERLAVHVRAAPHGRTGVTLVHRAN
jgi:hypothetical protein